MVTWIIPNIFETIRDPTNELMLIFFYYRIIYITQSKRTTGVTFLMFMLIVLECLVRDTQLVGGIGRYSLVWGSGGWGSK